MPDPLLDLKNIAAVSLQRAKSGDLPLRVRTAFHDLHVAALQADLCVEMEETLQSIRTMDVTKALQRLGSVV
jgi:hypothetical protein